jgi:hypothetical protein
MGLVWFRGQGQLDGWDLRPPLFRHPTKTANELLYEDHVLLSEFMRVAPQLVTDQPRDHWDWYFLMQHYGAPTRLLDWSDNALVALYFAVSSRVRNPDKHTGNPVVFAVDPWWLNDTVFGKARLSTDKRPSGIISPKWDIADFYLPKDLFRDYVRKKYPLAIDPPHVSRRIAAQRSRFIIFGKDPNALNALAAASPRASLIAIPIHAQRAGYIHKELLAFGISHNTLFPDLHGLALELQEKWRSGRM